MQSDPSSSSPKRSVSVDPFQDPPISQSMSPAATNDDAIDAYMAEQGEALNDVQFNPSQNSSTTAQPDPGTKLTIIDGHTKTGLQQGQTWYLVSTKWYNRWHKVCTGEVDKAGEIKEEDLGSVDNTPLVDSKNRILSEDAVEEADYLCVPEVAWDLLVKWYVSFSDSFRVFRVLNLIAICAKVWAT